MAAASGLPLDTVTVSNAHTCVYATSADASGNRRSVVVAHPPPFSTGNQQETLIQYHGDAIAASGAANVTGAPQFGSGAFQWRSGAGVCAIWANFSDGLPIQVQVNNFTGSVGNECREAQGAATLFLAST